MILGNCRLVTMDDDGSEHARRGLQFEDGMITALGDGGPDAMTAREPLRLATRGGSLVRTSEEEIAREQHKEAARLWR